MFYDSLLGTGGLYSLPILQSSLYYPNPAFERDGQKGSLAKFGLSVGFVCFAKMPCKETVSVIILKHYKHFHSQTRYLKYSKMLNLIMKLSG
jgi:hypothetical protein